ncbi:MAG: hypothetical protein LBT50_11655, partial [Prevotellaceae bacterium]|nr:hypothetical protein [Prevotellaceae bacterium]
MQENIQDKTLQRQAKPKQNRWKRIVPLICIILLIILILPPIIISIPAVQTFTVGQISNRLSKQLKTEISIKSVNISLINRVRLNGIYVEDINKDTLLYVAHLDANIGNLPLNGKPLTLSKIKLTDGIFRLKSDSTGTNITNIIKNLKNPEIDKEEKKDTVANQMRINVKALELKNFRYTMYLNDAPAEDEQPDGIIYKNMSVSNINLDADRIAIKNDSLTFRVSDF